MKNKTEKINKNLAYILGVLCGDGSISKSANSTFEIELRTIDKDFALEFKRKIKKNYGKNPRIGTVPPCATKIRGKTYKCKRSFRVRLCSKIIYYDIVKFGKFKTNNWRAPMAIMNSKDEKIICSFLRGFLDSEATPREYCVEIASSNRRGLNDIKKLLSYIGIKRFYFYRDWKGVWKLIFSGKDNLLILYKKIGFTIQRKQIILKKSIKYKLRAKGFKKSVYGNALKLREKGYTYSKISEILKINADTIRGWCKRGYTPYDIQRQIKLRGIFTKIHKDVRE